MLYGIHQINPRSPLPLIRILIGSYVQLKTRDREFLLSTFLSYLNAFTGLTLPGIDGREDQDWVWQSPNPWLRARMGRSEQLAHQMRAQQ
jgi:hypothetical protein